MNAAPDHYARISIIVASTTLLSWIALGTFVFRRLEDWTLIQSFYFSVVTITTVGYGDLTPSTEMSRLFTAIYILVGVSVGLVTLGMIGAEIVHQRERSYHKRQQKKQGK